MRFNVLLTCTGLAATQLPAQQPPIVISNTHQPQIRTSAVVIRPLSADLAVARFEFSTRGNTLSEAARAAAVTGQAIRRAVARVGVPDDSILGRGSVSYPWDQSLQMEVKPNPEFRRYDTTYVFRDFVEVRMHNMGRVAEALDAALAAGAQKLVSLQFSSTRVRQVGQEALSDATRQVRRNAELMAEGAGGRIGRVLELTTNRSSSGGAFYDLRTTNPNTGTSQPIYGGTATPPNLELWVSVYGSWELLTARDSTRGK
jgi:hypothetical protein